MYFTEMLNCNFLVDVISSSSIHIQYMSFITYMSGSILEVN